MKLSQALPLATFAGIGLAEPMGEPQYVFSMPEEASASLYKIPTPYESAVQGRRILALTPNGVLSTVFPESSKSTVNSNEDGVSTQENRPAGLGGLPIGLMDYIADCEEDGNPTILAIGIATSFKNVAAGSNISLAIQWTPPYPPAKRIRSADCGIVDRFLNKCQPDNDDDDSESKEPVPYSAANLPRFSIIGYLENLPVTASLSSCFVKAHPDAKYWLPGNSIHEAEFVRLVVQQIYWIGGFGDRAYIGWLNPEDWKNITREEYESVKLPGEKKGWKEWSMDSWQEL
ncbi:putative Pyridoxamine 5'-phosphate oxidase-domain-containing protein [Seiridium cardinale]|uniref:Pyridoxamine 5'-phosphate oxidase-domain-containing protein n=1 Tax=Seiridium cardinale TaxID=138064 RepID=A0ABR2XLG3_9PEZI